MSVVAEPVQGSGESVRWPVVAALTCGHFRTFPAEDAPVLHQYAACFECENPRPDQVRFTQVRATASVGALIEVCDRFMASQRIESGGVQA